MKQLHDKTNISMISLVARLWAWRNMHRTKKITLREAAQLIGGVSHSTLSRIEKGERNIDLDTYLRIADFLDSTSY